MVQFVLGVRFPRNAAFPSFDPFLQTYFNTKVKKSRLAAETKARRELEAKAKSEKSA
jgi:hypothetical protein